MDNFNPNRFNDMGVAIVELIKSHLRNNVGTSFLAKVNSINDDNTVDIQCLFNDQIISKIKVAIPSTGDLNISMQLNQNDLGLAIVSKFDISAFEKGEYQIIYPRLFNSQDCVFIPLAFNFDKSSGNVLSSKQENIQIQSGNKIVLKNKTQSLGLLFSTLIDTILAFQSTNAAQGAPVTCGPATIQSLNELKLKFKELFDE